MILFWNCGKWNGKIGRNKEFATAGLPPNRRDWRPPDAQTSFFPFSPGPWTDPITKQPGPEKMARSSALLLSRPPDQIRACHDRQRPAPSCCCSSSGPSLSFFLSFLYSNLNIICQSHLLFIDSGQHDSKETNRSLFSFFLLPFPHSLDAQQKKMGKRFWCIQNFHHNRHPSLLPLTNGRRLGEAAGASLLGTTEREMADRERERERERIWSDSAATVCAIVLSAAGAARAVSRMALGW